MNTVLKSMNKVASFVDKSMKNVASIVKRDEVAMLIGAIVVAYVAFLERDSINPFAFLMGNPVVRALSLLMVVYISMVNAPLGLLLAIAFVLTIAHNGGKFINFEDVAENFANQGEMTDMKLDGPGAAEEMMEAEKKNGVENNEEEGFYINGDSRDPTEKVNELAKEMAGHDGPELNGEESGEPVERRERREGFQDGSADLKTVVLSQFKEERRPNVEDELKTLISAEGGNEGNTMENILTSKPAGDELKKITAEAKNLAKTGKSLMDPASANFNAVPMLKAYVSKRAKTPDAEKIEGFCGAPVFALA